MLRVCCSWRTAIRPRGACERRARDVSETTVASDGYGRARAAATESNVLDRDLRRPDGIRNEPAVCRAVIDLFLRRIVEWSMQAAMTTALVTEALPMALCWVGPTEAVLSHRDQDSHYTSEASSGCCATWAGLIA
jgi:transposase InsO family protein